MKDESKSSVIKLYFSRPIPRATYSHKKKGEAHERPPYHQGAST
jgi:hypothetical protein